MLRSERASEQPQVAGSRMDEDLRVFEKIVPGRGFYEVGR